MSWIRLCTLPARTCVFSTWKIVQPPSTAPAPRIQEFLSNLAGLLLGMLSLDLEEVRWAMLICKQSISAQNQNEVRWQVKGRISGLTHEQRASMLHVRSCSERNKKKFINKKRSRQPKTSRQWNTPYIIGGVNVGPNECVYRKREEKKNDVGSVDTPMRCWCSCKHTKEVTDSSRLKWMQQG